MALVTYDTSDASDDDEGEFAGPTKSATTPNIAQVPIRETMSKINQSAHELANEPESSNLGKELCCRFFECY